MTESQARRLYPAILIVLGLLLFLPALSSSGLWDPYEVRIADAARAVQGAQHRTWAALGRPPATVWAVAFGFEKLGVGELSGRLPLALLSLLAVLATYYAGAGLLRRRGAFLGAAALATTPGFLFSARQLTSNAPALLAAALAVGGLGRAAWPSPGTSGARRGLDLVLGLVGLGLGWLSSGLLVGVLAPLGALSLALAWAGGPRGAVVLGWAATLGAISSAIWAWRQGGGYSRVLGGVPHPPLHTTALTTHLKQLGFSAFPWVAAAPLAAAHLLARAAGQEPGDGPALRERFGWILVGCWFALTYLSGTVQAAGVADLPLPLALPLLLAVGAYLDHVLVLDRPLPFAGLTVALVAVLFGRDLFLSPELYIGAHVVETVRWPGLTRPPYVFMAFAAFWGGVMGLGLGAPLAAGGGASQQRRGRSLLIAGALAASLAMSLGTNHWLIPTVSHHLSARDLYGKTKQLDPTAPVGQYRFNATGSAYYAGGRTPTTLGTLLDLFRFLGRPTRVFVMVGADELAAIDQHARQQKIAYHVIDDSNSRFLVLSNRLGGDEQDRNPLRRFISETPPTPQHPVRADFEGKVELIGYDLPATLQRSQAFKIRLHFKVKQPVGGAYKVFIHFDGQGTRFNGDHVPLEGRFPTAYWAPGFYVTDEHTIAPDRNTQPRGAYRVLMGFFLGDRRLKVVDGPQDGDNRVKLGLVTVK